MSKQPLRVEMPAIAVSVVGVTSVQIEIFADNPWHLAAKLRINSVDAAIVAAALQAASVQAQAGDQLLRELRKPA
jgi:hypothetical protein